MTDAGVQADDPQAPTVAARVDRADGRVGDALSLTVTAVSSRMTPVNLPAQLDLAPFSILEKTEAEKDLGDGRISRTFTLKVAAYEPGELTIPAVEVTYLGAGGAPRTVRTAPVAVKIRSVIANEPEPQLKENAAPVVVMEENRVPLYVTAGLGAAALGAFVALIIRRRMRNRVNVRPEPPARPAHELALLRLDRLGAGGFEEGADLRPFYFELSETIRAYLGGRYGFDGLESTTEELLFELGRHLKREVLLVEVNGWLSSTDLVKFAKISPTVMEARGALEAAFRLVESTRPRSAPVVSTAALPGGGDAGG